MEQVRDVLKRAFNIHGDTASHQEIRERILSGGEVRGTNLCVLVLAIFIASIGLNMNSAAVIIGAMLISPLMGGIMAIGYGIATGDLRQSRNSCVGLLIQIVVCLVISTFYFAVSPISATSQELLARTNPTIWDVLIACFGGFAGIIGTTRKEKSNVIPGVAIATALMPPLCTAGYGIAIGSLHFFLGAMYLFLINIYFICLMTVIGLLLLKVPQRVKLAPEIMKRVKKKVFRSTLIFILPSIFFGYRMVAQEMNASTAAYESGIGSIDVERVVREVGVVYPQVTDIRIGYLKQYQEESGKVEERLSAIVYSSEPLADETEDTLEKWLAIETDVDDFLFVAQ